MHGAFTTPALYKQVFWGGLFEIGDESAAALLLLYPGLPYPVTSSFIVEIFIKTKSLFFLPRLKFNYVYQLNTSA